MKQEFCFLKKKPTSIMIVLKDESIEWYPSKIASYCGASYVYVTKFVDELKKMELVTIEKKGKNKRIKITEKGKTIAGFLEEITKRLQIKKEEKKQI